MSCCVYKTDPNWHSFLAGRGAFESVYFWRNSQKNILLHKGDDFYFADRALRKIVGCGKYSERFNITISQGWKKFQEGCGAGSLKNLVNDIAEANSGQIIQQDTDIQFVELYDVKWLSKRDFIDADDDIFFNWNGGRFPYRKNISQSGVNKLNAVF